ncbi:hypothetical protein [Amycolatopsis sp. PS_44_ISF1]|uniref:hypothetical protein n=1 Tax=Amycolatopsis sp. PS_44_ISF1 TaxID=2974917 RepID=UPI0028DFEA1E|nr:hypothetical protein [Amycolatopsis sp. PS_44_ISF1]MDT8915412.1 hypothetical protein [Amycolatopsis sp. PS_44_ISF1]
MIDAGWAGLRRDGHRVCAGPGLEPVPGGLKLREDVFVGDLLHHPVPDGNDTLRVGAAGARSARRQGPSGAAERGLPASFEGGRPVRAEAGHAFV